jgi:hypothetical protein
MSNLVKIAEIYTYPNVDNLKKTLKEKGYLVNNKDEIKIPGLKSNLAEISNGKLKVNFRTEYSKEALEFRKNLVKFMKVVKNPCYF